MSKITIVGRRQVLHRAEKGVSGRVTVYVRIWGKFQAEGTAKAKALRWGVPRAPKEQCGDCCAVWSEQSEHREGRRGRQITRDHTAGCCLIHI